MVKQRKTPFDERISALLNVVAGKKIQNVIPILGDAQLQDNSICSKELRALLRKVTFTQISNFVDDCLRSKYEQRGLILQDLVNEIGRRLDFKVEHGVYHGRSNTVGFDGIWESKAGESIIVEVKSSNVYSIDLEKQANYKKKLVQKKRVSEDTAILFVVGDQNTKALETQIRGSPYVNDMRVISVTYLRKLLEIKTLSDDKTAPAKIRKILNPFEYIKIDGLIGLVFETAEDIAAPQSSLDESVLDVEESDMLRKSKKRSNYSQQSIQTNPVDAERKKKEEAVKFFGEREDVVFVQHQRSTFWDESHKRRVVVAVSKHYDKTSVSYWYAYHTPQDEFLREDERAHLILAFFDNEKIYAIPRSVLADHIKRGRFRSTASAKRSTYWHIKLHKNKKGQLAWYMPKVKPTVPLENYRIR